MQHEGSILLGDKFRLDIRFSWDVIWNLLKSGIRDERLIWSISIAAYGFVDPKYTINQRRLPDACLYIYAKFDQ